MRRRSGSNSELLRSALSPNFAAVESGYVSLSGRQARLLDALDGLGAQMVLPKNQISIRHLGAFTAATGDEFALFTLRGERLLVRGGSSGILLSEGDAMAIAFKQGSVITQIGPGGVLHSLLSTVAVHLENGHWGSSFPFIMHDLYQGSVSAKNADAAYLEMQKIKAGLAACRTWGVEAKK